VAVTADLDIIIGDTYRSPRWAVVIAGQAVDLTDGWTVRAQIRQRLGPSTLLHDFTGTGIELGTAAVDVAGESVSTSTIRLWVPPNVSEAFNEFVGRWDCDIYHPTFDGGSPYRRTILTGAARARWDVTRA
jgi:hypothetical protein